MKKYTIDRFEGDFAVCEREDGSFVDIPRTAMPKGSADGSCIIEENGIYTLDKSETESREEKMRKLFDSLRK